MISTPIPPPKKKWRVLETIYKMPSGIIMNRAPKVHGGEDFQIVYGA